MKSVSSLYCGSQIKREGLRKKKYRYKMYKRKREIMLRCYETQCNEGCSSNNKSTGFTHYVVYSDYIH